MKVEELKRRPGLYRRPGGGYIYVPSPGVTFVCFGDYGDFMDCAIGGNNLAAPDWEPITQPYTANFKGATFTGVTVEKPKPVTFQWSDLEKQPDGVYVCRNGFGLTVPTYVVVMSGRISIELNRKGYIYAKGTFNDITRRYECIADVTDLKSLLAIVEGGAK